MYRLTLIIRYLLKRRITHFAIAAVALCVFIVVVVMTLISSVILWGMDRLWSSITNWLYGM